MNEQQKQEPVAWLCTRNDCTSAELQIPFGDDWKIEPLYAAPLAQDALDGMVRVPRALAERSAAMFQSVDPQGSIALEWTRVIDAAINKESK